MNTASRYRPVLCVGLTPAIQDIRGFNGPLDMGEVNRCATVSQCAAGKGTNVARVIATLGRPPLLIGFAGGPTGALYRRELRREGLPARLVTTAAPTRVCVTLLEQRPGRVTELVQEAALPTAAEWRAFHRLFTECLRRSGLVTLTGALMPGAPPTLYRDLAARAARLGIPVVIDSQKAPLLEALAQHPLLAKLNGHELGHTLAFRPRNVGAIVAGARALLARGAANVLVTQGARGAWLVNAAGAWHYPSPAVRACNPIGSGDAVTAGIALALNHGEPLMEAVSLGIACGAANVLTPTPGCVRRADVARLRRQIAPTPVMAARS